MSISARRKSLFETRPTGLEIRQTQRRPIEATIPRVRPFSVKAAELARRKFLHLAAGAATLTAVSRAADAQTYPTRPITMIVPFFPGGGTDLVARVMAESMRRLLGQPIVIENIGGASGSVGVGRAARANPDGYTLNLGTLGTHVLNGAFYSLPYNVLTDFAPISPLIMTPFIIFAKKAFPAGDLKEMITWLKANPNNASAGTATIGDRLAMAFFQKETGTHFALIPYRGSAPAIQDLVAGQIEFLFAPPDLLPLARSGSVKAYAVTSDSRLETALDIPTVAEMGLPSVSYSGWYALFAPKGTPKEIIGKINAAVAEALSDPTVRSRFVELGFESFPRERHTPEALGALVKVDAAKWWPIIKELGIKAE
jgi:tripartite-type tricarboxylate transporter receptor subunit TctC